jgi:mono/diheme cytochrome c family protein
VMASSGHLQPGEKGKINVSVDIRGRLGIIIKTITVFTNDPVTPVATLSVRMNIKDRAHLDRYAAGEIFGKKCKGCHVDHGKGKTGWDLFRADCFICHNAGNSISLSEMSKKPREYLRKAIREGVDNTVMPGWDVKNGGPFDDADVESLLELITR